MIEHYALHTRVKKCHMAALIMMNGSWYHKWSLTICDGCFDTLKSSKCEVRQVTKDVVKSEV